MLTKIDLKAIEDLLDKKIKNSLIEFFETLLLPYFDHNEEDHKEIKKQLEENDKDHDKIFRSLERNREEHDEMFVRLDRIQILTTS